MLINLILKKKIFNFKNVKIAEKKILLLLNKNKIEFICLSWFYENFI